MDLSQEGLTPSWHEWRDAPAADFAVIGDPIAHSLSPRMHQAAYAALGLDHRYVALRVAPGEVAAALAHLAKLGYQGVNVTVPHKGEAFETMRSIEEPARRTQAVNTVRLPDLVGTNTDGAGFLDTIEDLRLPRKFAAVILGAGGSARSVVLALAENGHDVRLYNRTKARAIELVETLGVPIEVLDHPDPTGAHLIVNATSAGLHGAELPIAWSGARSDAVAYDLVYGPQQSPFLAAAQRHGLRVVDGLPLLAAQGARSLEWWLGVTAPRQAMLECLRWVQ